MGWVRLKRYTVAFEIASLQEVAHLAPIASALIRDYPVDVCFVERMGPGGQGNPHIEGKYDQTYRRSLKIPFKRKEEFTEEADLVVSSHYSNEPAVKTKRWVHIFHGIADKGWTYSKSALDYDKNFLIGKKALKRFKEKGIYMQGRSRFKLIGLTRLDYCTANKNDKELQKKIYDRYGLDSTRNTVMHAPSWGELSCIDSAPDIIKYCIENGLNLLIKPHPNLFTLDYREEIFKEIYEAVEKHSNIVLVPEKDSDISPLFLITDLLISDFSSVGFEFLVMNKPVVFIDTYETKDIPVPDPQKNMVEYSMRDFGSIVNDVAEIPAAIGQSLRYPGKKRNIRRKYLNQLFYKPNGHAVDRACKEIMKVVR